MPSVFFYDYGTALDFYYNYVLQALSFFVTLTSYIFFFEMYIIQSFIDMEIFFIEFFIR